MVEYFLGITILLVVKFFILTIKSQILSKNGWSKSFKQDVQELAAIDC